MLERQISGVGGIGWDERNRTANAVRVRALPGFKSPSLRSLTSVFSCSSLPGRALARVLPGAFAHSLRTKCPATLRSMPFWLILDGTFSACARPGRQLHSPGPGLTLEIRSAGSGVAGHLTR